MVNAEKQLSSSLEDYLEAILNIAGDSEAVRSKDIAESLGVAKSSVTGALRLLSEKNLVNYKPYGIVTLTKVGRERAEAIARKHDIVKAFFINILGVDSELAQKAACKVEHALGPRIISRLRNFIEFVTQNNKAGSDMTEEFKNFCENKPAEAQPLEREEVK